MRRPSCAADCIITLVSRPCNDYSDRLLVTAYRTTKLAPKPEGQGLNDLYVRFFRMAERRIVEKRGKGVICYISNYSWLDGLSHTGMRERYLDAFDHISVDCLNGDKYKTGKLTPQGDPDPSIFSTESNREGIQGTAITLLVLSGSKKSKDGPRCRSLEFRHLWGKAKHAELNRNASGRERAHYENLEPPVGLGYPFFPIQADAHYFTWPLLPDLFPVSFPGVQTCRDEFLVDIDQDCLSERIQTYFDPLVSHDEIARRYPTIMQGSRRYRPEATRDLLLKRGPTKGKIVRYAYRPFDTRWVYWEPQTKLLDEKRSEYFAHVFEGNLCIAGAQHHRHSYDPPSSTRVLGCRHLYERGANLFPVYLKNILPSDNRSSRASKATQPNLSETSANYISNLGATPEDLFLHCLATLFSPAYVSQNSFSLRQDWPRIPLPKTKKALLASGQLGQRIAAILDTEKPVDGITVGKIDPRLKDIGVVSKVGPGGLDPGAGHLDITAGWGHVGKGGVCMPGAGKHEIRAQRDGSLKAAFGDQTLDIYLNETAYWSNVPKCVWDYHIGGYQVIKKWLSYREKTILGRGLRVEEAEYVTEMARRIASLVLMQPDLDANYEAVKADTWPWPHEKRPTDA
jgi:hypothetical protein